MKNPLPKGRIKTLHFILFFFASFLIIFCIRWQIVNGKEFKSIADGRVYTSEIDSLRGSIYAKDGTTLAYSEPRYDMFIWYKGIEYAEKLGNQTREDFVDQVAPIIDKTPEELENLLEESKSKGTLWIPAAKSLDVSKWRELNNLTSSKGKRLEGFQFEYTSKRIYPESRLAAQIIGLTTNYKNKFIGVGGLEEEWDGNLNPRKGIVIEENDAKGELAATSSLVPSIEPKRGKSIYTSIDKKLQIVAEEKVKENVERFEARRGSIIIMDPKTGEIMAFANYPTYDPNVREEQDPSVYGNSAISSPYEIGSVGKVFTMAAAIDLGVIERDTVILPNGHEGCEFLDEELGDLCTWDKKPQAGPLTAERCLILSDNICFHHISLMMDPKDFHVYLEKFGIGRPSGVDLAGESYGSPLPAPEDWDPGDRAAFSYGHGYLVNALQGLDAVATIANNGVRMKPHLVTKVVDEDTGEIDEQKPIVIDEVLSKESSAKVAESMYAVYQNNILAYETQYSDLKNYSIGMKSGSALIANQFGYTSELNNTYVGFDMSPDRKFAMLVWLERPTGGLSFYNTRTMWLDTFAAFKDHLQVPRR